ncbi:MAG: LysM peptidoglycan-binding domain-containing protein, partial [Verrucomicrobiae bacterium]|nr:LysM peptidoglycan-binding domain-containing protein [Verrucomicrobiae bacterium]NNJ85854.1 LysM peptidoglycan-binding domain-containing protein [Akkermansiaceae bacterium]
SFLTSYFLNLVSSPRILILMRGRMAFGFGLLALLTMLLASCGGGGGFVAENRTNRGYNPGVGPFDSRGNYVERWANDKSKGRWWRQGRVIGASAVASTDPQPTVPTPPVIASNTTPIPQPTTRPAVRPTPPVGGRITPAPRPKPKPTVRAKPKRKPPIRHTVKKGDTLWALSRKYKTTVTNIQRANGLKGTNLKIGRRLLIPRY